VSGKMIRSMAKESIIQQMVINMKVNITMIKSMVKEFNN